MSISNNRVLKSLCPLPSVAAVAAMGKSQSKLSPEQLEDLQMSTHFSQEKIKAWYKDFMLNNPSGRLSRKEFNRLHEEIFPLGDPSQFSDHVFEVFDRDHDGTINFKEFICPLSLASRGGSDDKLKWVFRVYDLDGDDSITYEEMLRMVKSVYKMADQVVDLPDDEKTPEQRVKKIFDSMDKNHDHLLTYEEFREGSKQDPVIAKALSFRGGLM